MNLYMTNRVHQHEVFALPLPPQVFGGQVVGVPAGLFRYFLLAMGAQPFLPLIKIADHSLACKFVDHQVILTLFEVGFVLGIVGIGPVSDFDMPLDGHITSLEDSDQVSMQIMCEESPVPASVAHEVAPFDPPAAFLVSVAAISPFPKHLPDAVIHVTEGVFGHDMAVVHCPSPDQRSEVG